MKPYNPIVSGVTPEGVFASDGYDTYTPRICIFPREEFWVARASVSYTTDVGAPVILTTSACESRDYRRAVAYALTELALMLEKGDFP